MPWESRTVEEIRKEFIQAAQGSGNFSSVCREFGITRRTGYKWLERDSMKDQSRRPHHSPHRTAPETEALILRVREENPGWGARTIRQVLENQGILDLPCAKTVNNILHRHGCIQPEESEKRKPFLRFEKDRCNEMWQTDFKGEFRLRDGSYCYPLNILDDHSRFSIRIAPRTTTKNVVIPVFLDAFREYGLPNSILSDNGAQFAGFRKGFTRFERWLMDLDILPIHGRVRHPQTQGKIERFHRTMNSELLKHHSFEDISDAQMHFQQWRDKYNRLRPHEALGMMCPAQVYQPSSRPLPERISPFEYGGEYHVIKVNSWGYVRFDRWQVYLSETMIGQYIEFRPEPDGSAFSACYRNFRIASFKTDSGELIHRNIARL